MLYVATLTASKIAVENIKKNQTSSTSNVIHHSKDHYELMDVHKYICTCAYSCKADIIFLQLEEEYVIIKGCNAFLSQN